MSYVKLGADKIWFGSKALDALADLASKRVLYKHGEVTRYYIRNGSDDAEEKTKDRECVLSNPQSG